MNPNIIKLPFEEAANVTTAGWSIYSETEAEAIAILSVSAGNGTTLVSMTLERDVAAGEVITCSYNAAVGNTRSVAGGVLRTFSGKAVENNIVNIISNLKSILLTNANQVLSKTGTLTDFNPAAAHSICFTFVFTIPGTGLQILLGMTNNSASKILEQISFSNTTNDQLYYLLFDTDQSGKKGFQYETPLVINTKYRIGISAPAGGGQPVLYIDGRAISTTSLTSAFSTQAPLGADNLLRLFNFNAAIDYPSVGTGLDDITYDAIALNASQMAEDFLAWDKMNVSFAASRKLLLDAESANVGLDKSGNGNDFTFANTPGVSTGLSNLLLAVAGNSTSSTSFTGQPTNTANWSDLIKPGVDPSLTDGVALKVQKGTYPGQDIDYLLAHQTADILTAPYPDIAILTIGLNEVSQYLAGTLYTKILQWVDNCLAVTLTQSDLPMQVILQSNNLAMQNIGDPSERLYANQQGVHAVWLAVAAHYASNPNVTFVDTYASFNIDGVDSAFLSAHVNSDGVHPNTLGYQIHNDNMNPVILTVAQRVIEHHL